jgi:hypothetical protein
MPSITLKNIPDPLYQKLVESARNHHRSLTKELVVALESYVQVPSPDKQGLLERIRAVRNRYPPTVTDIEITEWKEAGRA